MIKFSAHGGQKLPLQTLHLADFLCKTANAVKVIVAGIALANALRVLWLPGPQ